MFKWLNKQGVEKDGEFYLQRVDRFHYEYGESGKSIRIILEPGSPIYDVFVSDAVDSEGESERIGKNVAEALKFMGHKFRII